MAKTAQSMVNFRLDADLKKNMEEICKEMGMSMTTAFTIFANKVFAVKEEYLLKSQLIRSILKEI